MKIAVEVWGSDYEQVEATCRFAEAAGIDACYYGESPHDLNLECWTVLAALARATQRIRLGPVVAALLPTYRSRALLARQVAAVATISSGRLDLRLGAGAAAPAARPWWEPFGVEYPDYDTRLAEAADTLVDLPRLLPQRSGCPSVPVTVTATGERAMALAARADVWETSFCTAAEFAARNTFMDGLVGDRPLGRSLEVDGFVATTPERYAALVDRIHHDRAAEDLGPVFERALTGTPGEASAQLDRLASAGVTQVVVALHDPHDPDSLAALAQVAAARAAQPTASDGRGTR